MTEHKGQWNLEFTPSGGAHEGFSAWCSCKHPMGSCEESLDSWELERRINATERLSAGYARAIADDYRYREEQRGGEPSENKTIKALLDYADILEGK